MFYNVYSEDTVKPVRKPSRWLSFAVAFLAFWLLTVRIVSSSYSGLSLPKQLQDLITLMTSVILESLPFVILGILLSVIVRVWLPDQWLMRHLPKKGFLRRMSISFLGVLLPVCECGNVPLSRGLIMQGFTVAEALTFLLAAPILNPITIITTQQAFPNDHSIVIARIVAGFAIANLIGWLYSKHRAQDSLLTPSFAKLCKSQQAGHTHGKRSRSFKLFAAEAANIMPALFIGAFIAAFIQVLVPRSILYEVGSNPLWSIGAMMALAFVVSICSNVDAFFALAFSNSFTSGSIVSFLVFGPIIDIKMLNLMKTTFKAKVLLQISIIVGLLSAISGLVVHYAF